MSDLNTSNQGLPEAADRRSRFRNACIHLTAAQRLVAESGFRAAEKSRNGLIDPDQLIVIPKGYSAFVESKIEERERQRESKQAKK